MVQPDSIDAVRFWAMVDRGTESQCWLWRGIRGRQNYGRGPRVEGKERKAHRLAWILANARPIPDGALVLHSCDNPPCCNPAHLRLGTVRDNHDDQLARKRTATGDRNGARLHPERLLRGNAHHFRRNSANSHCWKMRPEDKARGESCASSKLTEDQVRAIRAEYVPRKTTKNALTAKYGVCLTTIAEILSRHTWAHVE